MHHERSSSVGLLGWLALAVAASAACTTPASSHAEPEQAPGNPQPAPGPAGGECLDIRTALVRCREGEAPTHDGCPEPSYMQRCAPSTAPPTTPTQPAPGPTGGQCIDVRAVMMRCQPGEVLTHDGCPEPAYMQRCAVSTAPK